MWANTVAEYAWLRPYLPVIVGLIFLAGMACFLWPWLQGRRKPDAARYKIVCEALKPLVIDATRRDWLAHLLTGARADPNAQQYLWHVLQQKGIIEGDFYKPGGLVSGFEPALRKWLRNHPLKD